MAARALPAAAGIFGRLQGLLQNPDTSLGDIVDLVKLDAGFASAVVRAANNVIHRQGEPIGSVNDAINRVGLREVHRILGEAVASQLFVRHLPLYKVSGKQLWENSLAVAVAMSAIALRIGEDGRAGYTLGLLRCAGRLVLQRVDVTLNQSREATTTQSEGEWERARFGLSNAETTAYLLDSWRLAPALSRAARHHLRPEDASEGSQLAARLHVACWIADSLGKGLPCEQGCWRAEERLIALAQLPAEVPAACLEDVRVELSELESLARGGGSSR